MDSFDKWLDEYCYKHLDCNLVAILHADALVSGKQVRRIITAIKEEFVDKPAPRCDKCEHIQPIYSDEVWCMRLFTYRPLDWYCADFKAREK